MKYHVGDKLPVIVGQTQHKSKIDLSEFFGSGSSGGRNLVLYFYPKDYTPGCTLEAQEFNRLVGEFEKLDTQIVGVSTDTKTSHASFYGKYQIEFPLIADEDKRISRLMGVLDTGGATARRVTFIINKKGVIKKIYPNVKPAGHAKEVLEYIRGGLK